MKKILRNLRAKSPTILSCVAAVGLVSTVILAVKATPKAMRKCDTKSLEKQVDGESCNLTKKEIFHEVWKEYLPAAAVGVGTLICIFASNSLNKRNQAMITSAYTVLNHQFKRYTDAVKEKFGEETHNDILNCAILEQPVDVVINAPGLASSSSIIFDKNDENEVLFYDMMSKRYFKSTIGKVMTAIHHLNRNFCLGADPEVNMYYDFLGLEGLDNGDRVGWSLDDGLYWVDFEIFKSKADNDTLEYYVINPIFWPEPFPVE